MYVLKGRFNVAKVMLPEDQYLDEATTTQIYTLLNHPAMKGDPICIMPDAHMGSGACIGFTMPMNEYVIVSLVGVDIGCGMLSVKLNKQDIDLKDFDEFVGNTVPSGFKVNNYCHFEREIGREGLGFVPVGMEAEVYELANKINPDKAGHFINSLGSLGGGRNFLQDETEINID